MAQRFWVGGAGNWDQSTTTHWASATGGTSGAAVPTASDDVFFDANSGSGTVTITANAPCNSLQSAGSSIATLVQNSGVVLSIGSSTVGSGSIALDLSGFTTYTLGNSTSSSVSLISTSTTQQTIKTGGLSLGALTINGSGSSYKLLDSLVMNGQFLLTLGGFDANGFNVTMNDFNTNNSNIRTLTLGTGTWFLTGLSGDVWLPGSTNLTFSGASATIKINTVSTSGRNIWMLNAPHGTIDYTIAGSTGSLFVSGPTTINTINFSDTNNSRTLQFSNSQTYTITNFNVNGQPGLPVTFSSNNPGNHTLSIASGTVQVRYLIISYSAATGGAIFNAVSSTNTNLQVSGWTFPHYAMNFRPVNSLRPRPFAPGIAR